MIETIITSIIDLILGKAGVSLKPDQRADLQAKAMELAAKETEGMMENLNKQAEINAIEATNGRLGWRNFLCWGLTIAVLYQVFQGPLIAFVAVVAHLFGIPYTDLLAIKEVLPQGSNIDIVGMLMALAGLYGWRGHEKLQYAKIVTGK